MGSTGKSSPSGSTGSSKPATSITATSAPSAIATICGDATATGGRATCAKIAARFRAIATASRTTGGGWNGIAPTCAAISETIQIPYAISARTAAKSAAMKNVWRATGLSFAATWLTTVATGTATAIGTETATEIGTGMEIEIVIGTETGIATATGIAIATVIG